jgi:hypothetical protein
VSRQPTKVSIRNSVVVILIGAALAFAGEAHLQDLEPSLSKDHPLLELDLRSIGYQRFVPGVSNLPTFVDFTDATHVALAWLTLDARTATKKTRPRAPEPAHLHVFSLDARTGQKQGLQEWPTPSYPVHFLGVRDGEFLICAGNLIRLFSASFEVIRERQLSKGADCRSISPSRQLLLLSSRTGPSYENTLLDVGTLATVGEWTEKHPIYDVSSHFLVGGCGQPTDVCIRRVGQPWQPFQPAAIDERFKHQTNKFTFFVNDETLVVNAWWEIAVARVDGTLLFRVELPKKRSFSGPIASGGRERFAVIENRQRGLTSPGLDMYAFQSNDRVIVYSIPERRAIYAVKVKGASPWPISWEPHVNQLSLSPDGALLAIVSDELLRVYRLP